MFQIAAAKSVTISVVNSLPLDDWRSFVDQHPAGNIFHTPEMFEVFQCTKGFKPELWATLSADHQILVLFLPVHISIKNGLLRPLTTRSIAFGSILCDQSIDTTEALQVLLRTYQQESGHKSLFTELRNLSSITEFQPTLSQLHFNYEDHLDYLIPLNDSPEAIFSRIGKRTQKNIRRGIKHANVAVEEVTNHSEINNCIKLLQNTYNLAHVPLPDRSLFETAFDYLYPKGMLRVTLATVGTSPAATSIELLYKDTIYGWYGGMDRSYSAYVPNELLMWHILEWGSENGYRVYDFGGAGKPDEKYGVRDFKAKFGGNLVCYGRNSWIPHPLLFHLSEIGYTVYRQFL